MTKPKKPPKALERFNDDSAELEETRAKINLPAMGWKSWPRWQKALVIALFAVIAISYAISLSLIRR